MRWFAGDEVLVPPGADTVTGPRYNIAPTAPVWAVRSGDDGRVEAVRLRWGLVPSWATDITVGARLINARSETAATKPSFRDSWVHRRCLIAADGFYEWQQVDARKQPHFIALAESRPFFFAGLWDRWTAGDGTPLDTCTILTTAANAAIAPIHERMPVILAEVATARAWLDGSAIGIEESGRRSGRQAWPPPLADNSLRIVPVGTGVGRVGFDSPECVRPLALPTQSHLF